MTRHRWSDPDRRAHETIRTCVKCGILKITRHEHPEHWTEFWNVDQRVDSSNTPACVPDEQGVVHEPA